MKFGAIAEIQVNNKKISLSDKKADEEVKKDEPRKDVGFIAVSIGDGMNEILKGLGVDQIIEGGQTMNPSTEDVLNAIAGLFKSSSNKTTVVTCSASTTCLSHDNCCFV